MERYAAIGPSEGILLCRHADEFSMCAVRETGEAQTGTNRMLAVVEKTLCVPMCIYEKDKP